MRAALDAPIRAGATVLERIQASGHPALVVFETPGCAPCESLHPVLEQLAQEFQDRVLVVRVSDAAEGWLAARYHLNYVPTLTFWRGGLERARIRGNPGHAAIRAHIEFLVTEERQPEPAEGERHTLVAYFGALPTAVKPRALLARGRGTINPPPPARPVAGARVQAARTP
jgi:thiol-disulfide isomerase/thioredoxin